MLPATYLGRMAYAPAWKLQEETRAEILSGNGGEQLFLVEHPPTISLGRGEKGMNLLFNRDLLRSKGFDVIETNRGGKVTYHGPGQLVVYPIVDIQKFGGVKKFVFDLEEVMIRLLASYGISTERRCDAPGAWVNGKKIGSIGIHVRRHISIHGLALNVHPDLSHFDVITPCGIPGVQMTSMEKEGVSASMEEVFPRFISTFEEIFFAGQSGNVPMWPVSKLPKE